MFIKESGEEQAQQIARDDRNDAFGRQVFPVQMIDAAELGVGRDKAVGELGNRFHEARIYHKPKAAQSLIGGCLDVMSG